ncbi:MAG: Rieske 2Fe-2S domain-containing protein, partial [Pseudomonadota bacterium]
MKTQPMIHALPARYYTDPAIYAREETGLFAQSWQFALHAAVLRRPGDYATFSVASQNLFAVMGKDWQIRCFYNVCQHRGHELLNGTGRLSAI